MCIGPGPRRRLGVLRPAVFGLLFSSLSISCVPTPLRDADGRPLPCVRHLTKVPVSDSSSIEVGQGLDFNYKPPSSEAWVVLDNVSGIAARLFDENGRTFGVALPGTHVVLRYEGGERALFAHPDPTGMSGWGYFFCSRAPCLAALRGTLRTGCTYYARLVALREHPRSVGWDHESACNGRQAMERIELAHMRGPLADFRSASPTRTDDGLSASLHGRAQLQTMPDALENAVLVLESATCADRVAAERSDVRH